MNYVVTILVELCLEPSLVIGIFVHDDQTLSDKILPLMLIMKIFNSSQLAFTFHLFHWSQVHFGNLGFILERNTFISSIQLSLEFQKS